MSRLEGLALGGLTGGPMAKGKGTAHVGGGAGSMVDGVVEVFIWFSNFLREVGSKVIS